MKIIKLFVALLVLSGVVFFLNEKTTNHVMSESQTINKQDKWGKTALYRAVEENRVDEAIALMNNGADLEIADKESRTPLHIAVQQKHYDAVSALLSHGAQSTIKDKAGLSPVDYAQNANDKELLELFEEA